jgi:hypothetical protein
MSEKTKKKSSEEKVQKADKPIETKELGPDELDQVAGGMQATCPGDCNKLRVILEKREALVIGSG